MLKPSPDVKSAPTSRAIPALPPPLWVWIATGIGALLSFLLLFVFAGRADKQQSYLFTKEAANLLRQEWAMRSDSVMRVVVLGTSLVEYGVADTEFFKRRCGKRVRLVKLYRESVGIDAFTESSPIFQLLERYPPDVLCIEENLVLFRRLGALKQGPAETIIRQLHLQADAIKIQIGWLAPRQKRPSFQGFPPEQHVLNQADTLNLLALLADIRSRKVRTQTELPALSESLQRLHQRRTRLVLLHLPRPAILEAIIQGEERGPLLGKLIAHHKQRYQMEYWHFNRPMPFRYFADQAHLNHLGNPIYSAWLADKICRIHSRNER